MYDHFDQTIQKPVYLREKPFLCKALRRHTYIIKANQATHCLALLRYLCSHSNLYNYDVIHRITKIKFCRKRYLAVNVQEQDVKRKPRPELLAPPRPIIPINLDFNKNLNDWSWRQNKILDTLLYSYKHEYPRYFNLTNSRKCITPDTGTH